MKILKKLIKWCLIAICFLFIIEVGLYIYKYYTTIDINKKSENSFNVKIYKNKNKIFKYGNKGNYPILQVSTDNKNWKNINIRGFLFEAIPLEGSRYDNFHSIHNTVWFYHLKSCIECDCSNYIYNIYYSHDNSNTWSTIIPLESCIYINFENDKNVTMIYGEGQTLFTRDGGKIWQKKN